MSLAVAGAPLKRTTSEKKWQAMIENAKELLQPIAAI